jgi:acetyltransferase-like isoleucine patch superfamily enzyme
MDKFLSLKNLLIANLSILVVKLLFFKYVKFKFPVKSLYAPKIRVRNGGEVFIHDAKFRSNCFVFSDGGKVVVGSNCFFNNGCSLNSMGGISIGCGTLFGENVKLYDHNHMIIDGIPSHNDFVIKDIIIGANCWIGSNSIILPGVTICDGVTIGAGCIVTKSISESGVYVSENLKIKKLCK